MKRAIIVPFHQYTPFGHEFYKPIAEFFTKQLTQYQDEFDTIYLINSNWGSELALETIGLKNRVIFHVNPSLRYYDAYKKVLPEIKEDLVLFMDNDMVIYRKGIIENIFNKLNSFSGYDENGKKIIDSAFRYHIVSIYDTCGNYKTDKLNGKNKFCPYLFASSKDLLMKYKNCNWGDHMPEYETFGDLTREMLNDGIVPYEMEEDKSSLYLYTYSKGDVVVQGDTNDNQKIKSKNLGYYHIRSGSVSAYLLATKYYGDKKTYFDYLNNQPKREYLRQLAWYYLMTDVSKESWSLRTKIWELLQDIDINEFDWMVYYDRFKEYHGL